MDFQKTDLQEVQEYVRGMNSSIMYFEEDEEIEMSTADKIYNHLNKEDIE